MFILTEKLYFWFLFHGHKNNSLFTIPILAQVFTSVCTNIWQIFINPRKVFVYAFKWVFKIRDYFDWELNGCCRQMMCWLSDIEELRSIRRHYITLQPRTFSPNLHRSQITTVQHRRICHHGSHGYHLKIIKILEKRAGSGIKRAKSWQTWAHGHL